MESQMNSVAHQPVDAVTERLDDPAVAASLVARLDNVELLPTSVLGLSGLLERGDTIMDVVAEGVHDFGPNTFRWPHDIAGDGERFFVADAENNRFMVWDLR